MAEHTPGPWYNHGLIVVKGEHTQHDGIIAKTVEERTIAVPNKAEKEAIANARLIAAAPDMYDALKQIVSEFVDEGYASEGLDMAQDIMRRI